VKLNPEDLDVLSFDTTSAAQAGTDTLGAVRIAPITTTNDPTAATRCFICPPITYDCV
jgi:hypothetical protein